MGERKPFEFFLLRYVPDAVRDEFVNIGVVLSERSTNDRGFADVRFTRDWQRVRCLDPQADVELLEALEREIRGQLGQLKDREMLLRWLEDSFSNVIQLSQVKGCLAEDPKQEVDTLASIYLERHQIAIPSKSELVGRRLILGKMREAFERAGVLDSLRPFPIAQYTDTDDAFKFDFGYRVGNEIKLFHALSLKASVDAAVKLTSKYARVTPRIVELTQTTPLLTAVIEDDVDRGKEEVQYTMSVMRMEGIGVAPVANMPKIAETAKRELRL